MSVLAPEDVALLDTGSVGWFLDRDLKVAAGRLGAREARFLVDSYYAIQDQRKQSDQRMNALSDSGEPNALLVRLSADNRKLEANIKNALDRWSREDPVCQWARSIPGIGPVISAGLAAYIDVTVCPTAGHIWSYAGLNPDAKWEKGQKRPWNASLKTLCWKIGESFVKVSGRDDDIYGGVWRDRKALETARNEAGQYASQAAAILAAWPAHKQAAIYKTGMLSPGHIHSRAKRYAVKLFLAHLHHVMFETEYGKQPPFPYVFEHAEGQHVHYIAPPNWPLA